MDHDDETYIEEEVAPAEREEGEPDPGDEDSEDNVHLDRLEDHRRVRMLIENDDDEHAFWGVVQKHWFEVPTSGKPSSGWAIAAGNFS